MEDCRLIQDPQLRSSINREAFFDQQEWNLYEHVATEARETKEEYSFVDDNSGIEQKKHSILSVTCRAGTSYPRQSNPTGIVSLQSSSTGLLLLERILSDLPHHDLCLLCLFHSTRVSHS